MGKNSFQIPKELTLTMATVSMHHRLLTIFLKKMVDVFKFCMGGNPMPGMPFNQQMLFPIELTLRSSDDGSRLFAKPIDEIKKIYGRNWIFQDKVLEEGHQPILGEKSDIGLYDISVEFKIGSAERFGLIINNVQITYEIKEQKFFCQERYSLLKPMEDRIKIRILVDRTTLEIFANDGQIYMPVRTHINITDISEELDFSKWGTGLISQSFLRNIHTNLII